MVIEDGVLKRIEESDIVDGKFVIPDGVTEIDKWVFSRCSSLKDIEIPNSVSRIGFYAFLGCSSLKSINIPEGVTFLGDSVFDGCIGLENIKLPDSLREICKKVFKGCKSLKSIEIPDEVTNIGEESFMNNSSLENIKLPKMLEHVSKRTFENCKKLKKIKIPKEVVWIEEDAFSECESLTYIDVDKENQNLVSEDGVVFNADKSVLFNYPMGKKDAEYEIPVGVEIIADRAFKENANLETIVIPKSVDVIEEYAFLDNTSLTEINIPDSVKIIKEGAFCGCENAQKIKISQNIVEIEEDAFACCEGVKKVVLPKSLEKIGRTIVDEDVEIELEDGISTYIKERAYIENYNIDISKIFGEYTEDFKQLKEKFRYLGVPDNDRQYDIFLLKMIQTIGIDEALKISELPKITDAELKQFMLEKDEMFNELYTTKYSLQGDFGATLEFFKSLNFGKYKAEENSKNSVEMQIFKEINYILENENGFLTIEDLLNRSAEKVGIELLPQDKEKFSQLEKRINSKFINTGLKQTSEKLQNRLAEGIVPEQIEPIQIMINDVISKQFKEDGKLDLEKLKELLEEKISHANAPYIRQNADLIVGKAMGYLNDKEVKNVLNHSLFEAVKNTKNEIGKGWKYKLNKTIAELGYSFDTLPEELSSEEIEKLQERLGVKTETTSVSVLKDEAQREEAYKLLQEKEFPRIMTYQQIHDMFGSVHEPYTEEFKEFFKENRERFLTDPKCIEEFGRIQSNFTQIINSPELKNTYQKGELTVDKIFGYFGKMTFKNQRPGDEELARKTVMHGAATNEEEFAHVQKIADIVKKRVATSVPPTYVKGEKYRGRMLSPDEYDNIFAGNATTCCQKFKDVGEGAMLLGSLEDNAGIFVVEEIDENGDSTIVGQSLTIRQKGHHGNNDRLTFDNIEIPNWYKEKMTEEEHKEILGIYQDAAQKAMELDKKFLDKKLKEGKITKEQYNNLVLKEVIAGTGYNDLHGLGNLPQAKVIVPDEAYYNYTSMTGNSGHPWIDSAGGEAPTGSSEMPVILAKMDEKEEKKIKQTKTKLSEVDLWYGSAGEMENLKKGELTEEKIDLLKQIEQSAYREEQQLMNEENVQDAYDLEYLYNLENMQVAIGYNKDWYMIYGEDDEKVTVSDLAIQGSMNAEKNSNEKTDAMLAVAEANNKMYELMIEAGEKRKYVFCNATKDTSLRNIKRMIAKGLTKAYDEDGNEIIVDKEKGLVYSDTKEPVEYRNFSDDGEIEMFDIALEPDVEKLKAEMPKIRDFLEKAKQKQKMKGSKKDEEIDEMRREIREDLKDDERGNY